MRSTWVAASVVAIALAGAAAANAQSARSGRTANEQLAAAIAAANTVCGSSIAVKLADSGPVIDPTLRETVVRGCGYVFDGVRMACRTPAGRAAVSARIKHVGCGVSGPGVSLVGGSAVSLERDALDYRIEPGQAVTDDSHMVHDYLMDYLEVDGQPLFVQVLKPIEEADLAREVATANQQCGSSITIEFDWTGVSTSEIKSRSPSNYCGHAIDAVARVCADGAGKEAVARQIKRIVCGYARERSISLHDGVLLFKSDFQPSADRRRVVFEYLQDAL